MPAWNISLECGVGRKPTKNGHQRQIVCLSHHPPALRLNFLDLGYNPSHNILEFCNVLIQV